jgi:uncharacterized membrane protein
MMLDVFTYTKVMGLKITTEFIKAAGLGIIAGMRTFSAPAAVSHLYNNNPSNNLEDSPISFIQTTTASKVSKVLAAAEFVGDKMPNTPNRTSAPGLTGRLLSGIFAGVTVYQANRKNILIGGLIGGSAALLSTFGCFYLRTAITAKSKIPDAVVGACEDALVVALGVKLAQKD